MSISNRIACAGAVLAALLTSTGAVADVKISQIPLAKAASQPIAPNLLFMIDDSGSMMQQYTPDYVSERWDGSYPAPNFGTNIGSTGDRHCRDSGDDSNSGTDLCIPGDPPYMAPVFNRQYYNPSVRYLPGRKANGDSYDSMTATKTTNWTNVPTDGYGKLNWDQREQNTASVNLTTQYPDRAYCQNTGDAPGDATCQVNGPSYAYPNASYKYGRAGGADNGAIKYRYGTPYYYNIKPIYCTNENATNCVKVKGGAYVVETPFRWCKTGTWTDCQYQKTSTYYVPSFLEPETAAKAVGSFKVNTTGNSKTLTLSVLGGGTYDLLIGFNTGSSGNGSTAAVAKKVLNAINANAASAYAASCIDFTCSNSVITLTAKNIGSTYNGSISNSGSISLTSKVNPVNGADGFVFFEKINIVSATTKYQVNGGKPTGRTDCVALSDGCSYDEEMTNFANWYAYYRTRLSMMKSAVSQAFVDIDSKFRVGFTSINKLKDYYVDIRPFDAAQRTTWYSKLHNTVTNGSTPLRKALSFAGRVYAGKKPEGITDDPVQYSCQQNFTLLTTDGYWNENDPGGVKLDGSTGVGDLDGGATPRPYYQGSTTSTNSLADTAMYYYQTDLRDASLANCTSSLTGADVCENNVPVSSDDKNQSQHMVTFTLGLGVDGQLRYRADYKNALSGDFYKVKTGTLDWPKPVSNTETAVDDLWHAAVNGRGQYFSAKDPAQLVASLKQALAGIAAQYGAGAAAATSNLEPIAGDNYAYVATYTTGKWTGNMEAREINPTTAAVSRQAVKCAENIAANPALGLTACTGTMPALVGTTSDTRTIKFNGGGSLTDFKKANLTAHISKFDVTKLSQYVTWNADYKTNATSERLIDYLRGQTGFDTNPANAYQLFRSREATLGDFVGSSPAFVCKSRFAFSDPGHSDFAASFVSGSGCTQTPMLYVGGNDGMLHAFSAADMKEQWAFVPTPVLSEMWRLADVTYGNDHRFYADGKPTVGEVCVSGCSGAGASWKRILVAGLNAGVVQGSDPDTGAALSGYYALDITDPASPKLLWEITGATAGVGTRIGFTYGNAPIVKVKDGADYKWAVLLTSGYKPAAGGGALIVVDAYTGSVIRTIDLPSGADGFSRIAVSGPSHSDLSATYVYGGDLNGNVWRIDPNTGTVAKVLTGISQPITTKPELASCNGKNVVYVGTGKFIEASDLTDKAPQSFYGFLDDYDSSGTMSSPRSSLTSLSMSGSGLVRTISGGAGGSSKGWYVDFPDIPSTGGAERVNVDPQLVAGTLAIPTNVPDSGICVAGGHSWFNTIQLKSCSVTDVSPAVTTGQSNFLGNTLVVGFVIIKLGGEGGAGSTGGGTLVPLVTDSGGGVNPPGSSIPLGTPASFVGRRSTWREMIRD